MLKSEALYCKYNLCDAYVKQHLSHARYMHCRGVAELAVTLCLRWDCEVEKGFVAGLLHDLARELDPGTLHILASRDGKPFSAWETAYPLLLHARAAVVMAQTDLGIQDEEILNAMLDHITGNPGMGILSQIIFVADLLEPSRTFINQAERQIVLDQSLDYMLLYVIEKIIYYNEKEGKTVLESTKQLYKEIKERIKLEYEKE